jgi:hypothetical protein
MITRLIVAFLFVCLVTPSTYAGFVLRFETSPGAGNSANFGLGTTNNNVNLYLVASDPSDINQLKADGVGTANLGSPNAPFTAGVTLGGIGSIQSANPNSDFDFIASAVNGTNTAAAWTASEGIAGSGVFGTDVGSEYYVLLGSFSVTAGNTFGDTGTLNLVSTELELTFNDLPLSPINVTSFGNFTFTAVPEPSAFLLMGMAITGGAAFMRRRKTTTQPAIPAKE